MCIVRNIFIMEIVKMLELQLIKQALLEELYEVHN